MTPEGKVKLKIDRWLDKYMPGHWKYRAPGGKFGKNGTPDILICWNRWFIGMEVKADATCSVTDLQMLSLRKIQEAGGIAVVIKGFDEARLFKVLELAKQ